jgi:hypothetical protein
MKTQKAIECRQSATALMVVKGRRVANMRAVATSRQRATKAATATATARR